LCRNISPFFNGGMTTNTEESENEKRPATPRSEAMRAAWAKRRASAAVETDWFKQPVCCCGCGAKLEVAKNPEKQRSFRAGHDSALKSLLRKINRGEAKREEIPQAARANVARIKFVQADPEFQKAFASPGPKARRQQKSEPGDSLPSETKQLARQAIRYDTEGAGNDIQGLRVRSN
jgi:hypothetical protein